MAKPARPIKPITSNRRLTEICSDSTVSSQRAVKHSKMARKISNFRIQAPGFGIIFNAPGNADTDK